MITESMIPMVVLPVTFLFVLLIILIAKAPRAGAWVVGSLVLLTPLFLWRLAAAGALQHEEAIPLIVVPVTFLFVLLVILLAKAPKVGASLIVALIAVVVLGLFFVPFVAFHRKSHATATVEYPVPQTARAAVRQEWTGDSATREAVAQEFDQVFDSYVQEPPIAPEETAVVPIPPKPAAPMELSPIWAEGIEKELEADVYPSKLAAACAAGTRLGKSIRQLTLDVNSPPQVVIFQEAHEYRLITELRDAVRRALPDVSCDVEAQSRPSKANELVVTLYDSPDVRWAPGAGSAETMVARGDGLVQFQPAQPGETILASGQLDVNLSGHRGKMHVPIRFTEKPWVENFGAFASERPQQHFIVARSNGTCMSEGEAHQQALDDARARLTEALGKRGRLPEPAITATDVLNGGFVVDQFAQSFEGSASKIWRQAMLLDVSGAKLAQLFRQKIHESRVMRMSWARMGFSVIGVTLLIGAIYFFLNMATRGYYEWSLRIAGIVLAIVAVISVLMVVK